jgi:hypothetical protein
MAAPETLLSATFVGILLTVVSCIFLVWACPPQTEAYGKLFSAGTVPPYNGMVSLKARYLLPWYSAPTFAGCRRFAHLLLVLARVGAAFSVLALIALIAWGLLSARV